MAQVEFITLLLISVSTSMVIVFAMLNTNRRWASLMAEMDRQFERMNRRFERFDHRFDNIESRLDRMVRE